MGYNKYNYSFKSRNDSCYQGKRRVWFTADTHFGHENIIKYCNRPFDSAEQMGNYYRHNHNSLVDNEDIVIFLGDVFFKDREIFNTLSGIKFVVKGNHDYKVSFKGINAEILDQICQITLDEHKAVLCHYPLFSWNGKNHGYLHLYGHVHNNEEQFCPFNNSVNVGVDVHGFCPENFDDILEYLKDNNDKIDN